MMILQQTLAGLCFNSGWNYAICWKLKQQSRAVLMWEDAYFPKPMFNQMGSMQERTHCDGTAGKRDKGASPDYRKLGLVVSKMSYHMYSLGEGVIGRVAFTGKHQWFFGNARGISDSGPTVKARWEKYPAGWQDQFAAGIQTIAVIAVRQGVVQLGSVMEMKEDSNLVEHIRNVFISLEKIPGVFLSDVVGEQPEKQRESGAGSNLLMQPGTPPTGFFPHSQMMAMGGVFNNGSMPMEMQLAGRMPPLVPYMPGYFQPGMMMSPQPFMMGLGMGPPSPATIMGTTERSQPGEPHVFKPVQGGFTGLCHTSNGCGSPSQAMRRPGSSNESVPGLYAVPDGEVHLRLPVEASCGYQPWSTSKQESRACMSSQGSHVDSEPGFANVQQFAVNRYSPKYAIVGSGVTAKLNRVASEQSTSRTRHLQEGQAQDVRLSVANGAEKRQTQQTKLEHSTLESEALWHEENQLQKHAYNFESNGFGLRQDEPLLFFEDPALDQSFLTEDYDLWEPGNCFGRGGMASHSAKTDTENQRDALLGKGPSAYSRKTAQVGEEFRHGMQASFPASSHGCSVGSAEWRRQQQCLRIGIHEAVVDPGTDASKDLDGGIVGAVGAAFASAPGFSGRSGAHETGVGVDPNTCVTGTAGFCGKEFCGKDAATANDVLASGGVDWEPGDGCDQDDSGIVPQFCDTILTGTSDGAVEEQAVTEVFNSSPLRSAMQLECDNGGPGSPETLEEILLHCEQQQSLLKPSSIMIVRPEPASVSVKRAAGVCSEQDVQRQGSVWKKMRSLQGPCSEPTTSSFSRAADEAAEENVKVWRSPIVPMTPLTYFERQKGKISSTQGKRKGASGNYQLTSNGRRRLEIPMIPVPYFEQGNQIFETEKS